MSAGPPAPKKEIGDYYEEARCVQQLISDGLAELPETGFVYLLSMEFYNFWKEKTNFEAISQGFEPEIDKTKMDIEIPRLNDNLVDWEETNSLHGYWRELSNLAWTQIVLKPGLQERSDYEFANKAVWELFKKFYPDAVEIKRPVYSDSLGKTCFKVYGRVVCCYMKPGPDIAPFQGFYQRSLEGL